MDVIDQLVKSIKRILLFVDVAEMFLQLGLQCFPYAFVVARNVRKIILRLSNFR